MKKIVVGALVAMLMGGTFVACGDSEKPGANQEAVADINISDSVTALTEKFPMRMPVDITDADLKDIFGVNTENIEEFSAKQTGMTPGIDVMGIFKAKDGKVEDVKADMQKILDAKKTAAYLPPEMEALDNAKIVTNGNYVGIFLLQGEEEGNLPAEKAAEEFNNLF